MLVPYFYNRKIIEGLVFKGEFGMLVVNKAIMEGCVITKNEVDYKVKQLIKIDGWGNAHIRISKCDDALTEEDKEILKKNEIIKITASPVGKINPGYDL